MEETINEQSNTPQKRPVFLVPNMNRSVVSSPNISSTTTELVGKNRASINIKLISIAVIALVVLAGGGYILKNYFNLDIKEQSSAAANPSNQSNTNEQIVNEKQQADLPVEWIGKYFPNCKDEDVCSSEADPDNDGLDNSHEVINSTDPNNPDSDKDGLSDGDEINIFSSSPLKDHTTGNLKYSDLDDIKSGYDISTPGKKFTPDRLTQIKERIKTYGLHQPTITSLGPSINFYSGLELNLPGQSTEASTSTNLPAGTDTSPEALLDRDSQRQSTIKKIGEALVKYKAATGNYPLADTFGEMTDRIKPYNLIATNTNDPINKEIYVYAYETDALGTNFTMSYYSETQKTKIKYTSTQAEKDSVNEEAKTRDEQRIADLENIKSGLLIYSAGKIAGNQSYVFPGASKYKAELVPKFVSELPKDPKTGNDYEYQVSATFDSFTLKTILEAPEPGTTGYLCNQEECRNY